MSEFFTSISDTEDIRQGDVIRQVDPPSGKTVRLGVVITADCDIAWKKTGDRYTWLEILPMSGYIEGPWAQDQLRKLSEKKSSGLCDALNGHLRKTGPDLTPLTHKSLVDWLRSKSAEDILTAVSGKAPASDAKPLRDLQGFAHLVDSDPSRPPMTKLKAAWERFGTEEKTQREAVRAAFKDAGGFQDYFVLPELPRMPGLGFVVMLRAMETIMAPDLYLSEQDARIDNRPDAFHRLGRLSDGVRFAITQKLAFLFSRIGMPTTFESACAVATDLLVEDFFKNSMEQAKS